MISEFDEFSISHRKIILRPDGPVRSALRGYTLPVGIIPRKSEYTLRVEMDDETGSLRTLQAIPKPGAAHSGACRATRLFPVFQAREAIAKTEQPLWMWVVTRDDDLYDARQLLLREHFRGVPSRGVYLACSLDEPGSGDRRIVGCAVLDMLTFSAVPFRYEFLPKPEAGARHCHKAPRRHGIGWVSRFAVEKKWRKHDIGRVLAQTLLQVAADYYLPSCGYVEVYATMPNHEWKNEYTDNASVSFGFLQRAGYTLCPNANKPHTISIPGEFENGMAVRKTCLRVYCYAKTQSVFTSAVGASA